MIKKIKNIDTIPQVYKGQQIEPNCEYVVMSVEEELILDNDATLKTKVFTGKTTINGGNTTLSICNYKIFEATNFATVLIQDFASENVALGITQLGLTSHVRKTLAEVTNCLFTASLYDSIEELRIIDPAALDSTIMSAARLLVFRNKIETFLGITPLATTWNQ